MSDQHDLGEATLGQKVRNDPRGGVQGRTVRAEGGHEVHRVAVAVQGSGQRFEVLPAFPDAGQQHQGRVVGGVGAGFGEGVGAAAGRQRVRQFELSDTRCETVTRVLVNGVADCTGANLDKGTCSEALRLTNKTETEFAG